MRSSSASRVTAENLAERGECPRRDSSPSFTNALGVGLSPRSIEIEVKYEPEASVGMGFAL